MKDLVIPKMEDNKIKEKVINNFIDAIAEIVINCSDSGKNATDMCSDVASSILKLLDGDNIFLPRKINLSIDPKNPSRLDTYNGVSDNVVINKNINLNHLFNLPIDKRLIEINNIIAYEDNKTVSNLKRLERL